MLKQKQKTIKVIIIITCMLIDVAISGDRNVIKKEAEKVLKYSDIETINSNDRIAETLYS